MHSPARELPPVDVIVAVLNEAHLIDAKLAELDAIDYPADRLRLVVVDGGSSDGTREAIAAHAAADDRWLPVMTTVASKTAQLNEAMRRTQAPWILVTDTDARVPADTLKRMLEAAARDPRVGVVGTTIVPDRPHPLDGWHWRVSNWIRRFEHRAQGTSGLVGGPCYLFRRALVDHFPADVVADDVHAVCRAATRGARTAIVDSKVKELRVAASLLPWYGHKVRRTLAYLREVFRFAPSLFHMPAPMRAVLLWRALALTLVPAAAIAAGWVVATTGGTPWFAGGAVLLLAGALPGSGRLRGLQQTLTATALPLWIFLITLTALVLYPFVRQSASYPRFGLKAGESEACS